MLLFLSSVGKGPLCYISTWYGVLGAVVIPVSIMLLFNVMAFIKTVVGIKQHTKVPLSLCLSF